MMRASAALTYRREAPRIGVSFDVIESPEWLAESLLLGMTTRTPIVVHLHTPLHVLFSFHRQRFNRDVRMSDWLERAAVDRAAVVTCASALLAETLKEDGWLRVYPWIIPLPVVVEAWSGVREVVDSAPNILVVGRLEPRKAPELVVEAAEILGADVPGLELTFVGRSSGRRDGTPYGEWVAGLAARKEIRARFVPQLAHAEIRDLYANARVLTVSSHFESFSIAALEAMASARPVVYTSTSGVGEVLRGSKAGTEVPPNDAKALAEALRPYLTDASRAHEAGKAGRELARTRLSPDIIAEQRERAYEEAIARQTGKA